MLGVLAALRGIVAYVESLNLSRLRIQRLHFTRIGPANSLSSNCSNASPHRYPFYGQLLGL